MRRECRGRFHRHRQLAFRTCITVRALHTHVPWCMPGWLTSGFFEVGHGQNVPGLPGACASCNFTYLVRGPWHAPLATNCDKDTPGPFFNQNLITQIKGIFQLGLIWQTSNYFHCLWSTWYFSYFSKTLFCQRINTSIYKETNIFSNTGFSIINDSWKSYNIFISNPPFGVQRW